MSASLLFLTGPSLLSLLDSKGHHSSSLKGWHSAMAYALNSAEQVYSCSANALHTFEASLGIRRGKYGYWRVQAYSYSAVMPRDASIAATCIAAKPHGRGRADFVFSSR